MEESMKEWINPESGPPAVGPYSPAVKANGMVFISGQIPIIPETGEILSGSIEDQVARVLENIQLLLESCGSSMDKVVRVGVFLRDLSDFGAMNEVYARYLGDSRPARSTVEVSRLPKDVDVEMDVIALE